MSDSLKTRVWNLETRKKAEFGIEKIMAYANEGRPIPDFAPGENKIIDFLNEAWERASESFALKSAGP